MRGLFHGLMLGVGGTALLSATLNAHPALLAPWLEALLNFYQALVAPLPDCLSALIDRFRGRPLSALEPWKTDLLVAYGAMGIALGPIAQRLAATERQSAVIAGAFRVLFVPYWPLYFIAAPFQLGGVQKFFIFTRYALSALVNLGLVALLLWLLGSKHPLLPQ